MAQRLGLAAALLAEPRALLLDEPANGLDPHGVVWLRALLRAQAAQGRAVLVSSHLLAEMQRLADHLLVIGRGRLLADEPTDRLLGSGSVLVRSPDADRLAELLAGQGAAVQRNGADELAVLGIDTRAVGELAHQHRLRLHELTSRSASLEAAFLELVDGEVEYLQAGAGRPDRAAGVRVAAAIGGQAVFLLSAAGALAASAASIALLPVLTRWDASLVTDPRLWRSIVLGIVTTGLVAALAAALAALTRSSELPVVVIVLWGGMVEPLTVVGLGGLPAVPGHGPHHGRDRAHQRDATTS